MKGKLIETFTPVVEVAGKQYAVLTPQLAGIPGKALGARVADLALVHDAIGVARRARSHKYPNSSILHILLTWLLWWGLPAHAALPDTVDKVRPSIVAVGTVKPPKRANAAGPALNYLGTGFVVGNGRQVITNFHVIPEKLDAEAMEALAVFVGRGGSGEARQARVVRSDPDHDVALLEIGGAALPALQLAESGSVREGEEIAFTGYPIGPVLGLYPATHRGIVSAVTPIVIPAMSSRTLTAEQVRRIRSPFDVYQLDATAYPGNSGSPVYNVQTGRVVGVINSVLVKKTKEAALTDPSGITYAIPVRFVRDLLARDQ